VESNPTRNNNNNYYNNNKRTSPAESNRSGCRRSCAQRTPKQRRRKTCEATHGESVRLVRTLADPCHRLLAR
jgi:hypothetical protein